MEEAMLAEIQRRRARVRDVGVFVFFFSSRRRHTRLQGDWSSDVCSSDLITSRVLCIPSFGSCTTSSSGEKTRHPRTKLQKLETTLAASGLVLPEIVLLDRKSVV